MAQYFEPLILAAIGAASKTPNHQQQMNLLDQTKTLAESALQMLYTTKEAGGNPKVSRRCMWQQCEPQTFVTCHTCMLGTKIPSKCLVSLLGGQLPSLIPSPPCSKLPRHRRLWKKLCR